MRQLKNPGRSAYRRLGAPVYFTPSALFRWLHRIHPQRGQPVRSVCVFTDERPPQDVQLHLEVFLPDGTSVTCTAVVAWVDPLPEGGPARFDVGLDFIALRPGDWERLLNVMAPVG